MKRFYTTLCTVLICLFSVQLANAQFTEVWSKVGVDKPSWFGTATERAIDYYDGKIYVASRGSGAAIRIVSALDGSDLGSIDASSLSGGVVAFNNVAISEDGKIFSSNLTTNASVSAIKIYMWDNDDDTTPTTVISHLSVGAHRLGDQLSVKGSVDDGTAVLYIAAGATGISAYRWSMQSDGNGGFEFNNTPVVNTLLNTIADWGTPAHIEPISGGESSFFATGRSQTYIRQYSTAAANQGYIEFATVNKNVGDMNYQAYQGVEYLFTYHPTVRSVRWHVIAGSPGSTFTNRTGTDLGTSSAIGAVVENTYGAIAVKQNGDGTFTVFVLATSNGIVAYETSNVNAVGTYRRTITGDAGWRMMSSPIADMPVSVFDGKAGIQGFANDGFTRNLFTGYNGTNWTPLASDPGAAQPTSFSSGQGFLLYLYNNSNVGSTPIGSGMTITATGVEPTSNVTVAVHSDGSKLNLLGNPYSTSIDVEALTSDGDFNSTVLVWDDASETWLNSSDILTLNFRIAPWQGFILENNTATEVTIPLTAKDVGGVFYKEAAEEFSQLQFRLYSMENGVKTIRDQAAIVQFRHDALVGWDRHDLSKMASLNAQSAMMYFIGDRDGNSVIKTQESRPYDFNERIEIPFDVVSYGLTGDMRIDWPILHQLPEGAEARILDRSTGNDVPLVSGGFYDFALDASMRMKSGSAETATAGPRFSLIVEPSQTTSTKDDGRGTMDEFALLQNYPNPFNPSTQIRFTLQSSHVTRLTVYDVVGREVAVLVDGVMSAGAHSVTFDASNLSSGVYLYKLEAGGQVLTKRMTLMK
jgi:hypothetical protein